MASTRLHQWHTASTAAAAADHQMRFKIGASCILLCIVYCIYTICIYFIFRCPALLLNHHHQCIENTYNTIRTTDVSHAEHSMEVTKLNYNIRVHARCAREFVTNMCMCCMAYGPRFDSSHDGAARKGQG